MPPGVVWAVAAVGAAALVGVGANLDLARPGPDPEVELDDEQLQPAPSQLSPEESEELQAQADPDTLRCEPRGCEQWRLALDDDREGGFGVVPFDDGDIVALIERTSAGAGNRVMALDMDTETTAWSFEPAVDDDDPADGVTLQPVGDHALVVNGLRLTALDRDGEVVWTQDVGELDERVEQLWQRLASEDVLLLAAAPVLDANGEGSDEPHVLGVGLDPASGEIRWSTTTTRLALHRDLVAAVDDEGRLVAMDPATGEERWTGPPLDRPERLSVIDGWVLAHEPDAERLFAWDDGEESDALPARPMSGPYVVDGDLVAPVVAEPSDTPPEGTDPGMELVRVDPEGSLVWRVELETVGRSWSCCLVDTDEGVLIMAIDEVEHEFSLDSGERLRSDLATSSDSAPNSSFTLPSGLEAQRPDDETLVVRADDTEVTVLGSGTLDLVSDDPLVVSDGEHLLGIRLPED